jgi:Flp pilus assembly protein CpaB
MSNMRVRAINEAPVRARSGSPIKMAIVSIEVTPGEAESLAIAAARGELQLALRGDGDADSVAALPAARTPSRR